MALNGLSVSENGQLLAYATAEGGSDWQVWHVRDIETGLDLPDLIQWAKFSGAAWLRDASGFYYARYDAPLEGQALAGENYNQKVYLHRISAPQSEDMLVYLRPDHKDWIFAPTVSDDGRYLVLTVNEGTDTRNRIFYQDLSTGAEFVELIPDMEAAFDFVGNDGARFYFRTDLHAPRGKLIAIDLAAPERANWQTLIAEDTDVLELVQLSRDRFIATYLHHAHHKLRVFNLAGQPVTELALPGIGSLLGVNTHRDDDELFYAFHSFTIPPTNCRHDLARGIGHVLESPAIEFDASRFETRQEFVTSKDGTRVPMFLVHRQGSAARRQQSNPAVRVWRV